MGICLKCVDSCMLFPPEGKRTYHVKDLVECDAQLDLDRVRGVHNRSGVTVVVQHDRRQEALLVRHPGILPEVRVGICAEREVRMIICLEIK